MSAATVVLVVAILATGIGLALLVVRSGQPWGMVALQLLLLTVGTYCIASLDTRVSTNEAGRIADTHAQVVTQRELYRNCRADLKARRQYRVRAVLEKHLLALQARANHLLAKGNGFISAILVESLRTPRPEARAQGLRLGRQGVHLFAHVGRILERISGIQHELRPRIHLLPVRPCTPAAQRAQRAQHARHAALGQAHPAAGQHAGRNSPRDRLRRGP